jgi:hypothetical protein
MPCKHNKDALIEAAASGAEPQGDLRAHLADCADCRATFQQELSLFASIDAGLNATANAGVPASLLPSVRARLDEVLVPHRIWVNNWLALASAAVILAAFLTARAVRHTNVTQTPVATAVNAMVPPPATLPPQNHNTAVEPHAEKNGVPRNQIVIAKNHPAPKSLVRGKSTPEVLVPHDQEILLAAYAEQWSLHKHPVLLAQKYDPTILSPLEVAPIQIDELGVKLLADEKSQ